MNISEFNKQRDKKKEYLEPRIDGYMIMKNNYEDLEIDPSDLTGAKTPYFLKVSKIREVIYVSEGVCSIKSHRGWHNALFQAGFTNAIVQKGEQRLLTLKELEQADQYFRGSSFSESSKGETTVDKATSIVQFNYRITMELAPKPVIPKGPPLKRERDPAKEKTGRSET